MTKLITSETLGSLSAEAVLSPRIRKNMNLHEQADDTLQRMLNAFEPGTYVCPHKHENPDKRELFILMRGRLKILIFDDDGQVTESVILDRASGKLAIEIPPRVWHSVVSLEKGSVAFEIKDGPYNPDTDKNFAPWAPVEGDPEANAFLKKMDEW